MFASKVSNFCEKVLRSVSAIYAFFLGFNFNFDIISNCQSIYRWLKI